MDFNWKNEKRRLQGLGLQSLQSASLNEITKEIRQGHEVFAICLHINMEESWSTTPPDIQKLLREYTELF